MTSDQISHIRAITDKLTHGVLPKVGETYDTQGRAKVQVAIADFVESLARIWGKEC